MLIRNLLAILFIASLSYLDAQTKMELKLKMGQEFVLEENLNTITSNPKAKDASSDKTSIQTKRKFKVINLDSSLYKLEVTLSNFWVCLESGGEKKTCYDSERPDKDYAQLGEIYTPYLNKTFIVYITREGRVIKSERPIEANGKWLESESNLNENNLEATQRAFYNFNTYILNKGDTWKEGEGTQKTGMGLTTIYKCVSLDANEAVIDIKGSVKYKNSKQNYGISKITYTEKCKFDIKTGLLKDSGSDLEMVGKYEDETGNGINTGSHYNLQIHTIFKVTPIN